LWDDKSLTFRTEKNDDLPLIEMSDLKSFLESRKMGLL